MFLKASGYDVNYTGGRAKPDLIVSEKRAEVPIEVKITSTSKVLTTA